MGVTETARAEEVIHNLILDMVSNHPADCRVCVAAAVPPDLKETAGMSDTTTLTKAEHDAAVAAAVAQAVTEATRPLAAELEDLKAAAKAADTDHRIATLQGEIDILVAEKAAAERHLVEVTDYLTEVAATEARAAEVAARRDARAAEVAAIGLLPADHIEVAKARWAELDDDAWTDKVAEYQAIATAHNVAAAKTDAVAPVPGKTEPPVPSPLTATAGADKSDTDTGFAFRDVFALRANGVDLTTHVH